MTWTNFSKEMPPDEPAKFIVKKCRFMKNTFSVHSGSLINAFFSCYYADLRRYEWTPYTPELWEELNK